MKGLEASSKNRTEASLARASPDSVAGRKPSMGSLGAGLYLIILVYTLDPRLNLPGRAERVCHVG